MHWQSTEGETVLDAFLGRGTAGVSCAILGSRFVGISLAPTYLDIACRRIDEVYCQGDLLRDMNCKSVPLDG